MKQLILAVMSMLVLLLFTGGNKRLSTSGEGSVSDTLFYCSGKTDTIKVKREKGVSVMSYVLYTPDSSNVTNVIVKRIFNNVAMATQAGDTIIAGDSSGAAKLRIVAVTMSPIADEYWFIVKYASTIIDSVHLDGVPVDSIDFTRGDTILLHSPLSYDVDTAQGTYVGYRFQRFDTTSTLYAVTGYSTTSAGDTAYIIVNPATSGIVWNESATSMNWMLFKELGIHNTISTTTNHARHGVVRQYDWQ